MYLTYAEYKSMGGTLDETAFNDFEFEAEVYVNWYTFSRLKKYTTYPDEVKKCMYKLIQLAKIQYDTMMSSSVSSGGVSSSVANSTIASQSNDGVSISYNILSADKVYDTIKDEMESVVNKYLVDVKDSLGRKLLYRGLYPGE